MLDRFERQRHLSFSNAFQDKPFRILNWRGRFNDGVISGRAFTGHAHNNAFFDCLLIIMRRQFRYAFPIGVLFSERLVQSMRLSVWILLHPLKNTSENFSP